MTAKTHVGFRLPQELIDAIDAVVVKHGVDRTHVVETWLTERAVAEGWLIPTTSSDA